MGSEYESFLSRLKTLRDENISFDDQLGLQNGFHEIERTKNELCDTLSGILTSLEKVSGATPSSYIQARVDRLNNLIAQIDEACKRIRNTAKSNTSHPNFINSRTQIHNGAKSWQSDSQNTIDELRLAIMAAESALKLKELSFTNFESSAAHVIGELNKAKDRADKIIATLQDGAASKTYKESKTSYSKLSDNHKLREWAWFWASLVAMAALSRVVYYIVFGDYAANDMPSAILLIVRKVFMLSVPLLILRISLTKYNIERFLRIVYDHRNAAISQLQLLEAAIDDDKPAKAGLRLEAAK